MSTQVPPSRLDSTKDFSSLVPSAFGQANLAFAQANAAYAQANTGGGSSTDAYARDTANAGFITANSASIFANGAFIQANAAYNAANNASDAWVRTQANNAYDTANSAGLYANGAFAAANSGSSAGFAFAQANAAFDTANSASLYANGAFVQANSNYTSAVTKLDVTNSGASSYLIDQYSGNNPSIYVSAGETIAFNLDVSGHPFLIRQSSGGTNTSDGLTHISTTGVISTGSGAQGKESGILFWKVPFSLFGNTFVYQCQYHSGMVGDIVIQQPVSFVASNTTLTFNQANGAFTAANTADDKATSAGLYANGSFGAANSASLYANGAFAAANSGSSAGFAFSQANAAFAQANAAFAAANTGGGGGSLTGYVDVFTGDGSNAAFTLSTIPSDEKITFVAVQGVIQPKSSYSLSGNVLTFDSTPPNTAYIEVTTLGATALVSITGSSITWYIANANTTMVTSSGYFVDTTNGPKTMTLPTSATLGDTIRINDLAGNFASNNLTVARNSHKIQGLAEDLVVDMDQSSFGLVYSNTTYGWKVLEL